MLVSMLAVLFLAFAALSACLGIIFGVLGIRCLMSRSSPFLGVYVIASGILGAIVSIMIGFAMRWNVIGHAIMESKILGCSAWAAVGFGWSVAGAYLLGGLFRRVLCGKTSRK